MLFGVAGAIAPVVGTATSAISDEVVILLVGLLAGAFLIVFGCYLLQPRQRG